MCHSSCTVYVFPDMLFLLLDERLTGLYFVNAAVIPLVSTDVLQKVKHYCFQKCSKLLFNHCKKCVFFK
jgi:hypothetical protein